MMMMMMMIMVVVMVKLLLNHVQQVDSCATVSDPVLMNLVHGTSLSLSIGKPDAKMPHGRPRRRW